MRFTDKRQLILLVLLNSISIQKIKELCKTFRIAYDTDDDLQKLRDRVEKYWDDLFQQIAPKESQPVVKRESAAKATPRIVVRRGKDKIVVRRRND